LLIVFRNILIQSCIDNICRHSVDIYKSEQLSRSAENNSNN